MKNKHSHVLGLSDKKWMVKISGFCRLRKKNLLGNVNNFDLDKH